MEIRTLYVVEVFLGNNVVVVGIENVHKVILLVLKEVLALLLLGMDNKA